MTRRAYSVLLTVRNDDDFGGLGLCLPGMDREGVNPSQDGLTVAHDLLEHQNGAHEIGGIDDELEALGAIWYVRGQFNDLRRDNVGSAFSVHENIAGDITRMFRDFFYGTHVDTAPGRIAMSRALPDADDDLREIIRIAVAKGAEDIDERDHTDAEIRAKLREYIRVCLPRMRAGYRKARRQYRSAALANSVFWLVADAIDKAIGTAKRTYQQPQNHLEEGQEYQLDYWFNTATGACGANCELKEIDYEGSDDE